MINTEKINGEISKKINGNDTWLQGFTVGKIGGNEYIVFFQRKDDNNEWIGILNKDVIENGINSDSVEDFIEIKGENCFGHCNNLTYNKNDGYFYTAYARNNKNYVTGFKIIKQDGKYLISDRKTINVSRYYSGFDYYKTENNKHYFLGVNNKKIYEIVIDYNAIEENKIKEIPIGDTQTTYMTSQDFKFYNGYIYMCYFEAGRNIDYQPTKYNNKEHGSALIYIYDIEDEYIKAIEEENMECDNLLPEKILYIPNTDIYGEIEDINIDDNGKILLGYGYGDYSEFYTSSYKSTVQTINYELSGGSNNKSNPTKYMVEGLPKELKDAKRTGYVFKGWYTNSRLTNKVTSTSDLTGNVTLYAKWEEAKLTEISITNGPDKTSYIEGQDFDKTGMVITASYNDGTSKIVTGYTVINGKDLKVGQTSITVSYKEGEVTKTAAQGVTVAVKTLTGISITHKPDKTSYIEGQDFDRTGMVVTASYDNGKSEEVTEYKVTNGTKLNVNQTSITVSYKEGEVTKITAQAIIVSAKVVSKIEIKENPDKMEYYIGEELDLTGLVLKVTYNNESTEEIIEGYTVNVTKLEEKGEQEVKITYEKQEVIFKVNVIEEKLAVNIKEMDQDKSDGITYLSTTTQNITEDELKSRITTNGDVTIEAKGLNGEIGTGSKIKISKNGKTLEYTLIIIGDLTGDGMLDDRDLLKMARYGVGLDKTVTGAYLRAGNIVKDENFANDVDLLKMARILVGLDNLQ